jgi:hypothetical protein
MWFFPPDERQAVKSLSPLNIALLSKATNPVCTSCLFYGRKNSKNIITTDFLEYNPKKHTDFQDYVPENWRYVWNCIAIL